MRKVIQVTVTATPGWQILYALCDDGSIWSRGACNDAVWDWNQLPNIPQDEEDTADAQD